MNYRHRYHAGNFADVFKHVLLSRMLIYLARKEAAFCYVDTHAGVGLYDLSDAAAEQTGESRGGIGRLLATQLSREAQDLFSPYLNLLGRPQPDRSLSAYPGSPAIAQILLRRQDRLTLCELHPDDLAELKVNMGRDARVKCLLLDGYVALNAFIPPKERRGLVLIDPPFEQPDEFERLTQALIGAHAKWAGGVYAAWYPIKAPRAAEELAARIAGEGIAKTLRIELQVTDPELQDGPARLSGCGLFIINPPFNLAQECRVILPDLARILGEKGLGKWRIFT